MLRGRRWEGEEDFIAEDEDPCAAQSSPWQARQTGSELGRLKAMGVNFDDVEEMNLEEARRCAAVRT
jgi:hypothetical protein